MNADIVQLHGNDNVAIAKTAIADGASFAAGGEAHRARGDIPAMHKIALAEIGAGEPVVKYNQIIGHASRAILPGEHVHDHCCASSDFQRDYAIGSAYRATEFAPAAERRTFSGYRRPGGKVGTRNYIAVLTSVNCSATVARGIASALEHSGELADYPAIDGAASFIHGTGCGMRGSGDGFNYMQNLIAGYANHPNCGGVLLIGLGCEVMQLDAIMRDKGMAESDAFRAFTIQDTGGTRKTIERGLGIIREMLPAIGAAQREPAPVADITLAMQCGGSDGFSGITANPALGAAVDELVRQGGAAILSETPELYGAEHLLTNRAASPAIAEALIARIKWWEDYTRMMGGELNNNPSPGNKAGGISTILEKSLGSQAKSGTTSLNGVFRYGEPIQGRGLMVMDSPGFDPVSVTGQVASGATVVCFTTGRGSAFGFKPAPVIKLSTNSELYRRMEEDMDVNCGVIIDRNVAVGDMGADILDKIIAVASGERTKSELLGYGDNEFTPWQLGAVV